MCATLETLLPRTIPVSGGALPVASTAYWGTPGLCRPAVQRSATEFADCELVKKPSWGYDSSIIEALQNQSVCITSFLEYTFSRRGGK